MSLSGGHPNAKLLAGGLHNIRQGVGNGLNLEHRKNSKRPYKLDSAGCAPFLRWMTERIRKNKRLKGRSIQERPALVDEGTEIGHWEADTVVGSRKGRGAAVFTAVEKVTHDYIAIRISGRTCAGIEEAIAHLKSEYGQDRFSQVFKTITVDNGTEFETFTQLESLGTKVYFAPPYSSWERPQNERHNGILRQYIPKGTGIDGYSDEDILNIADEINSRPRRVLDYQTPAELFNTFLDELYAIENVS